MSTDISKKKVERQLRLSDEFLSIASHELKTPLTPLKLNVQMLLAHLSKQEPKSEKVLEMIRSCDHQIDRLTSLVNDLLDVARIRTGHLVLDFNEANLSEILQEVAQRFDKQIQLEI